MINIITAVSRPQNIPRIHRSLEAALAKSSLKARWIIVVDDPKTIGDGVEASLKLGRVEILKAVYPGGGRPPYGIEQKNLGMSMVLDGYYHCLDDDNLVHPNFFDGIERAMSGSSGKKAFVFGQHRWDNIGPLVAAPNRMEYGKIDNTMFVVHSSLIGPRRYDLDRSGREDFSFFRKLYDLYPEEFVFIPETLAYYNYIQHFPAESPIEPIKKVQPLAERKALVSADVTVPQVKVEGVLKIALYSSNRDRCGISTYTQHLGEALAALGHDVRHWGGQPTHRAALNEILAWGPDIFHAQHETSIMPSEEVLCQQAGDVRKAGGRAFITLHTESDENLKIGRRVAELGAGRVVVHRPISKASDVVVVPMPCTSIGILPSKNSLRQKFGLPSGAFILSTVGFMIPWKDHPRLAELLIPWLKRRPDLFIQIIAAEHFNKEVAAYAQSCRAALAKLSSQVEGRILHVDGYPSDLELVERLIASNLGYVWCPFDTGSSSAAAAQFITARCPLVATDSSHYAYLGTGISRGPKKSMEAFIDLVMGVAGDYSVLEKLRAAQWNEYRTRNYIETARRHLALYTEGS